MNGFERAQTALLVQRLRKNPSRLILVKGPRQTGKTALVRQALLEISEERDCLYVSDDEPRSARVSLDLGSSIEPDHGSMLEPIDRKLDTHWLRRQWETARKRAVSFPHGSILVLDEIQKITNWSETVKGLWDHDRHTKLPLHVVLLGSAPLLMQQGLSESMAGRFESIDVMHWSYSEMSCAFGFDVDQFVYFGGYPGAADLIGDEERWATYVDESLIVPNIERDILALQRVNKPALLKRLFDYASAYSGQIVSYNKMQEHLNDKGNTTTFVRYLHLLSEAGMVTGLSNYSRSSSLGRASRPKLIVHNTSLMTARSGYSFEEAKADRSYWGRLVETAVGAHLLNTKGQNHRVFYWRNDKGDEVDFVLERAGKTRAIEVKSGSGGLRARGLEEFQSRYGELEPIVVGERGISLDEFLSRPASEWL